MMISEWMEHGTVMEFINARPGTNRLKLVSMLPKVQGTNPLISLLQLADISRGLRYLHEWPSVHADLKSVSQTFEYFIRLWTNGAKSNILIDSNHSARIADFGLTSLLRHPSISMSVSAPVGGGTIQWMAPELFNEDSRPSKESDIYALGMVIYEVCHIGLPGKPVLIAYSCSFSRTSTHFPVFSNFLCPYWSSLGSGPLDQQTGTFSACQRRSGR